MLTHSEALWRIDYRTDLTRSEGLVLPVGFVLEARWSNDIRWLGMLFRKRLTVAELQRVDSETWPEMKSLEPFMTRVFEQAWAQEMAVNGKAPALGSDVIASQYSMHSSLHFAADAPKMKLSNTDPETSFSELYARLLGLHDKLAPTIIPPASFPRKKRAVPLAKPARADVEQVLRAA